MLRPCLARLNPKWLGAFGHGNRSRKPEHRKDPPYRTRRAENPRATRKGWRFARTGRPPRRCAGRRLLRPLLCHEARHSSTQPRQNLRGIRRAPLRGPEKFSVPERHDARVRRDADAPGIRFPESQRSSELNDAYRVLRDPVARVEYLLGIEGARKEGEHKQQAPPELLEEVFELNESLD